MYARTSSPGYFYVFHRPGIIPQSITIQSPRNVVSTAPYVMYAPKKYSRNKMAV